MGMANILAYTRRVPMMCALGSGVRVDQDPVARLPSERSVELPRRLERLCPIPSAASAAPPRHVCWLRPIGACEIDERGRLQTDREIAAAAAATSLKEG